MKVHLCHLTWTCVLGRDSAELITGLRGLSFFSFRLFDALRSDLQKQHIVINRAIDGMIINHTHQCRLYFLEKAALDERSGELAA